MREGERAWFFLIHTNKHKGEEKGGSNKKEVWFSVPANQSVFASSSTGPLLLMMIVIIPVLFK